MTLLLKAKSSEIFYMSFMIHFIVFHQITNLLHTSPPKGVNVLTLIYDEQNDHVTFLSPFLSLVTDHHPLNLLLTILKRKSDIHLVKTNQHVNLYYL